MTEYMEDEKREGIKYEYYVSYIRKQMSVIYQGFTYGYIVAKPTDLRGTELINWLTEIIAEEEDLLKQEVIIIAISEIGSYIYEID